MHSFIQESLKILPRRKLQQSRTEAFQKLTLTHHLRIILKTQEYKVNLNTPSQAGAPQRESKN
jgi:hypothetical protein